MPAQKTAVSQRILPSVLFAIIGLLLLVTGRNLYRKHLKSEFFQSARTGDVATLLRMIQSGISINTRDPEGRTALVLAALRRDPDIVALLLQKGANPHLEYGPAYYPRTALTAAISVHPPALKIIELLLRHGVSPNSRYWDGHPVLHTMLLYSQQDIARLLLKYGADPNLRDGEGRTALMLPCGGGSGTKPSLLQEMLAHKPDVNARDRGGRSALYFATLYASVDSVKALLEAGADPNLSQTLPQTRTIGPWNPVAEAAKRRCHTGMTPLMLAALSGNVEIVNYLLAHGASVDAQTEDGHTALKWAQTNGRASSAIVTLLSKAGAKS